MKILVINTGSSSIKYRLFDMENSHLLAAGLIEKIGADISHVSHKAYRADGSSESMKKDQPVKNHRDGLEIVAALLIDEKLGSIADYSEITAVGHRIVHGGENLLEPELVTPEIVEEIKKVVPLAPLHNKAHLIGIEVAQSVFPNASHVVVFDTAFHHTMPKHAYMYAVPYELYEKYKVRKYGFHGTSHKYVSSEAASFIGKDKKDTNVISIHLGNGSSITAVKNGECVDTSMGLTPLAGLIMGTRCGDIDPAVCYYLSKNLELDSQGVDDILNKKSGFLGICGSSDLREVRDKAQSGDERGKLALDMLAYQIAKYVGSYYAVLGTVDAIVFTAGIGENAAIVREMVLQKLEQPFGIKVNKDKNWHNNGCMSAPTEISADDSRIKVLVVPTNEELQIARDTEALLKSK